MNAQARKAREAVVDDGCVSAKEAARFSGFSPWVIYEAMRDGALPYVQVGGRRVIPRSELRRFLADRLVLR